MTPHRTLARRTLASALGIALLGAGIAPVAAGTPNSNNNTSKKLRAAVSAEGVMGHERALQKIADEHGDTRVSGTLGYDESAEYAMDVFRAAGFQVTKQDFQFQTFRELSGTRLERVAPAPAGPVEATIMSYSGSGDVTAPVSLTTDSGSIASQGCEAADFAGSTAGAIALISRGGCTFAIKATNAATAGALGVVIYNNGPGALNGTLGDGFTLDLPVVGVTQAVGQELAALVPGLQLRVKASTFRGIATTSNVFAESPTGDPDNIVMAGAHLDSVSAGPGINDNGSGSAAILEVAEQMAKVKPVNKVRFALWGAEESGLVGSNNYIDDLKANNAAELERIALYLNYDMIGSPNYARFVYDGDNSAFPVGAAAAAGPPGSGAIEDMFHDYFESVGLTSAETPFSGRSDYGPFIAAGVNIPSGGLFTGAEGTKTAEQATAFGGVAGAAYDPCYHQACDSLTPSYGSDAAKVALFEQLNTAYDMEGNVNLEALEEMSDAVAHAVLTYAFDTRSVNDEGRGHPVSPPGQEVDGAPGGQMDDSGGGLHADHDQELPAS